jgi:ketosteroid isomerase-like protein
MFDPEIVWTSPETTPLGGTFRGPSEVAAFFGRLPEFYAELAVTPEQFVESGDTVTVLGRLVGRARNGTAFDEPFVHVWTVRNGRSVAFREFFDTARVNTILAGAAAEVPGQASRAATGTSRS